MSWACCAALGCTTSRAVRAWHDAEVARAEGDRATALRKYEEAYGRDGRLFGAEVSRLALLAVDPATAAQVRTGHAALAGKRSGEVEVELLGAGLDLVADRVVAAKGRLDGLGEAAIDKAEARLRLPGAAAERCGPLRREQLRLRLEVSWRGDDAGGRLRAAEALRTRCAPALRPREAWLVGAALLAAGDAAGARAIVSQLPAGAAVALRLQAALALRRGAPAAALAALEGFDDAPAALQRAAAQIGLGDGAAALAALSQARAAGASDAATLPLEAAALLLRGDAKRARDLLAGLVARGGRDLEWTTAFDLGLAALRLGDVAGAAEGFSVAATLCPSCEAPRRNLQALRAAVGD